MGRILLRRIAASVPVLVLVSIGVFALAEVAPGDIAATIAGPYASPERVEELRAELGLNDPFWVRYGDWAAHAVQGDLGNSLTTGEPVSAMIAERLPVTLSLAGVTVVLTILGGLGIGLLSAVRPAGKLDKSVTAFTVFGLTVPEFWLGLLLVTWLALGQGWFPALGYSELSQGVLPWLHALVLPAAALSLQPAAEVGRQLRSSMIHELDQQYVLSARAKGLTSGKIIGKHALKNASVPVVTVLGFRTAQLLGGVAIIEQIFVLPGLGSLAVTAVQERDILVIQGVVVFTTLLVILVNFVVDLSYTYFNPRVRH